MPFAFNAKYGLFTYAQCGTLDPFLVVELFSELGAECIIGRETHADEGIHLHAFVDFGRKYRTRDVRKFDVGGCHPNVEPSRGTPEKGYDYAIKDGDVVGGGLARPSGTGVSPASEAWSTIIAAEGRDEFWKLVQELAPRSLLCNFTSLRAYAEWRYRPEPTPYAHPECINLDTEHVPELDEWRQRNLTDHQIGG